MEWPRPRPGGNKSTGQPEKGETRVQPAKIAVIRIDLDKNSSSLAALDGNGTVVKRRHVIVTGALTAPFRQIVPAFERASGHKLVMAWGPSAGESKDAIPVRLRSGEPADVVIMIGTALDGLVKQGVFKPAMRTDIAQSGIGVGVRVGTPRPDVSSAQALKRTLLSAHSIGYSEGGSGVYVSTELLKRLGIADQLAPKMKLVTGELVGEAIARGDVEIGIQQISELRAVRGVDYLGPLPGDLQHAALSRQRFLRTQRRPRLRARSSRS